MAYANLKAGLAKLESFRQEIEAEKANSLGRVSAMLELCLEEMAKPGVAPEEFNRLRERAVQLRWFLEVQRDSLGIHKHEPLFRAYPIPEAMPVSAG